MKRKLTLCILLIVALVGVAVAVRGQSIDERLYKNTPDLFFTTAAERWVYVRSLPVPQRARWWQLRFLMYAATDDVTPEQRTDLLLMCLTLTEKPDLITLKGLEHQAFDDFPTELAREIFGLLAPGESLQCGKPKLPMIAGFVADCGCSAGSYFNFSCDHGCESSPSDQCNRLPDSCGFAGLFACDAKCKTGEQDLVSGKS